MDILLCLLGLSEQAVEPGGVVRRLVAVGVHAYEARDVGLLAAAHAVAALEEAVEEGYGLVSATQVLDPCVDVVRHIGAVLPAVGLGEVVVHLGGFEGSHPGAVALGMGEAVAVYHVLPALAAYPVGACCGAVAGQLGHLCNAPVVVGVFEGLADGLVVEFGAQVTLFTIGALGLGAVACGHHGVEQLLGGVSGKCAVGLCEVDICLEHHRHRMVAYHAVRLVTCQFPHRQLAALLVILHSGVYEVHRAFGFYLRQQRMQGAVGVPEREDGVDLPTLVGHVNLAVGAAVAAVLVAPQVGCCHAVVEGGVEAAALLLGAAVDLQLAEGILPSLAGGDASALEVLVLGGDEVAYGAVDVDAADGHHQLHLLGGGQLDVGLRRVVAHHHTFEGHVRADGEEEVLVGVPCGAVTMADDEAVVRQAYAAVEQHVAVAQVYHEAVALVLHISVAVVSHAAVGRKLHYGTRQAVVVEHHLIVSCFCRLVLMGEMVLVTVAHRGAEMQVAHLVLVHGHQQHVAVVLAACAAEVCVAEAEDGVVAVVVCAASVPSFQTGVRTRLDLSEGHYGTWERMSVSVGTDKRVDIRRQPAVLAACGEK